MATTAMDGQIYTSNNTGSTGWASYTRSTQTWWDGYHHFVKPTLKEWYLSGMKKELTDQYIYFLDKNKQQQKWEVTQYGNYTTTSGQTNYILDESQEHLGGNYVGAPTAPTVSTTSKPTNSDPGSPFRIWSTKSI